MGFTDVEMAILSQMAYYSYPDSAENKSLYEFLVDNRVKLLGTDGKSGDLGAEYAEAYNNLLNKVENEPYTIVKTMNDSDGTGFQAYAISDPNNEVTVACRGTEGFHITKENSRKDMYADLQLAYTLQSDQQAKMEEFMAELQHDYDFDGYYFTGHSLGGNLAMYGTIIIKDPSKLKGTVTFNAPGFNSEFWTRNALKIAQTSWAMTNYQNEMDAVSECFTVPGNIVILECDGWDIAHIDGISGHFLNMLIINENGEFKRNKTGKKSPSIVGVIADVGTLFTDVVMLVVTPWIAMYDMAVWTISKIKEYAKKHSAGYKYASSNTHIVVDTQLLRSYAQRVGAVQRRINSVDSRINGLYREIELDDLLSLISADALTGYSWRLNKCINYLNDSANDFANAENYINSMFQ